jgi:hypothetical protein
MSIEPGLIDAVYTFNTDDFEAFPELVVMTPVVTP